MIDLNEVKVTPRDQQVLNLLVQGCSNKEIAGELNISPRTVKQHLRTLFLRAGIRQGRKRVKLAIAMFAKEEVKKKYGHDTPRAPHTERDSNCNFGLGRADQSRDREAHRYQ